MTSQPERSPDPSQPELSIDPAVFDELHSFGESFLAGLTDQFARETELLLAQLREALATGDGLGVRRIAHSIKGSCAQLGGRRLAAACGLLEEHAVAGGSLEERHDLREIELAYDELLGALRRKGFEQPGHAYEHAEPLHVLLLEDAEADVYLILRELRRGGYYPISRRVASGKEMVESLSTGTWQVALLDYTMESGETAVEVLASLAELHLQVPAILISEAIPVEKAAEALRAGASDLVTKGNLARLVPAIRRELDQVEKQAERRVEAETLRQSEERLRLALDAGEMGSWEWYLLSDRLDWSPTLERISGLEPGAFGGTHADFIELVHPDDRELVRANVEEALQRPSPAIVYRVLCPAGNVRYHERRSLRVPGADGRFQVMTGVTFDVTRREEAAESLREGEERFRLITEHTSDLIALLDIEGRFRYASPSYDSALGYSPGLLRGTLAADLLHPDDRPPGWAWGEGAGTLRELRMRRSDGSWLWVEGLSYRVEGSESHFAVVFRDITERKQADAVRQSLEDDLRQSQKMDAVGQLAGGIAHDFNNLLAVIRGYTELLLQQLGPGADGRDQIAEIGKAADRAAGLTEQLLAYSRKQVVDARALDLNTVVRGMQTMLERVIRANIELSVALAEDVGAIKADAGQIEQIVMNLVVNARDAMPDGGKLLLETASVTIVDDPASPPSASGVTAGKYVRLTATDTGHGMSAATIHRIFEPFYTSKERGEGTGLGLATVYGIVKQGGGHIEVESSPGEGATFHLYFPQVPDEPDEVMPDAPEERSLSGTETILLVDDEEALLAVGKAMLEMHGYTVLLAGGGAEALELVQAHGAAIQLVMTDVSMPNMDGVELAEQLSALRPDLKLLYTSGYNEGGSSVARAPGTHYLQKPFAMDDLARALRDLLDPVT